MPLHYCESLNDLSVAEAISEATVNGQVDLAVSKDFWDRDMESEWEACESSFATYLDQKITEYSTVLGKPCFRGGMEDAGYLENWMEIFDAPPDDLVLWNHEGIRYAITSTQEDRELPFVVSFKKLD